MNSETKLIPAPDVMLVQKNEYILLANPRFRTHIVVNDVELKINELFAEKSFGEWESLLKNFEIFDATTTWFGEKGLHVDHTGFDEDKVNNKVSDKLKCLLKQKILIETGEISLCRYYQEFRRKKSILDKDGLGSLHQKVNEFLTFKLKLKENRWKWWGDQKYTSSGIPQLLDTPYKSIQENFFDKQISGKEPGTILDFGCGNGYYSNKLHQLGFDVIGIDTSDSLINRARKCYSGIEFLHFETDEAIISFLSDYEADFDYIFMQDVLALLIEPEDSQTRKNSDEFFNKISEALRPKGQLLAMECNPIFWLSAKYGSETQPIHVISEYRDRVFNISPNYQDMLKVTYEANLALLRLLHSSEGHDAYGNGYPIWDFYEFIRL